MILAASQCHHCWVEPSLVLSSLLLKIHKIVCSGTLWNGALRTLLELSLPGGVSSGTLTCRSPSLEVAPAKLHAGPPPETRNALGTFHKMVKDFQKIVWCFFPKGPNSSSLIRQSYLNWRWQTKFFLIFRFWNWISVEQTWLVARWFNFRP